MKRDSFNNVTQKYDEQNTDNSFINNTSDDNDNLQQRTGLRIIKFQKLLNNVSNYQDSLITKQPLIINRSKSPSTLKRRLTKDQSGIQYNENEQDQQSIQKLGQTTIKKVNCNQYQYNSNGKNELTHKKNFISNKQRPISPIQNSIREQKSGSPNKLRLKSPDFKLFENITLIKEKCYQNDWGESCRILTNILDDILKQKISSKTLYQVRLNMIVQKLGEFLLLDDHPNFFYSKLQIVSYALEKIFFINYDEVLLMISNTSNNLDQNEVKSQNNNHKQLESKYGFYPNLIVQLINIKSSILKSINDFDESYTCCLLSLQLIEFYKIYQEKHITLFNLNNLFGEQKKYQKAIQYGKDCTQLCEQFIKDIQNNNQNGIIDHSNLQLNEVVKVKSMCLSNMGIQLENFKKNDLCLEYLKKSYELLEEFNLTQEHQNLYFRFKDKYLELKEKYLNQEKNNLSKVQSFNSPLLSPIMPQRILYNNFLNGQNKLQNTQHLSQVSFQSQTSTIDKNFSEKDQSDQILEKSSNKYLGLYDNGMIIEEPIKQSQNSPQNLQKERILNKKIEVGRSSSPQKQIIQIYLQGAKIRSLSPSSASINQKYLKQIKLKESQNNSINHNTPEQLSKFKESSKISESNNQDAVKQKTLRKKKESNTFLTKLNNTLRQLDEQLKVKRCNSIDNQNDQQKDPQKQTSPQQKDIVKQQQRSSLTQKKPIKISPSRFKSNQNQSKQSNISESFKNLQLHKKITKQEDEKKLDVPAFEKDLELIKLEISWSSNSNYDDDEESDQMNLKKSEIPLCGDKLERIQFLQIISQEIENMEYSKLRAQQEEKEKKDKLYYILKKIKARIILKQYIKQRQLFQQQNKQRFLDEVENTRQQIKRQNMFALKLYIHIMKKVNQMRKEKIQLFEREKSLVQTFVKLSVIENNKLVSQSFFIKRVQVEGLQGSKQKFWVTLISKNCSQDRYSAVYTSEEILINLNLNRCKNQPVHTSSNIRQSFLTHVNPFMQQISSAIHYLLYQI